MQQSNSFLAQNLNSDSYIGDESSIATSNNQQLNQGVFLKAHNHEHKHRRDRKGKSELATTYTTDPSFDTVQVSKKHPKNHRAPEIDPNIQKFKDSSPISSSNIHAFNQKKHHHSHNAVRLVAAGFDTDYNHKHKKTGKSSHISKRETLDYQRLSPNNPVYNNKYEIAYIPVPFMSKAEERMQGRKEVQPNILQPSTENSYYSGYSNSSQVIDYSKQNIFPTIQNLISPGKSQSSYSRYEESIPVNPLKQDFNRDKINKEKQDGFSSSSLRSSTSPDSSFYSSASSVESLTRIVGGKSQVDPTPIGILPTNEKVSSKELASKPNSVQNLVTDSHESHLKATHPMLYYSQMNQDSDLIDATVLVRKHGTNAFIDTGIFTTLKIPYALLYQRGQMKMGDNLRALLSDDSFLSLDRIVDFSHKDQIKKNLNLDPDDSVFLKYRPPKSLEEGSTPQISKGMIGANDINFSAPHHEGLEFHQVSKFKKLADKLSRSKHRGVRAGYWKPVNDPKNGISPVMSLN